MIIFVQKNIQWSISCSSTRYFSNCIRRAGRIIFTIFAWFPTQNSPRLCQIHHTLFTSFSQSGRELRLDRSLFLCVALCSGQKVLFCPLWSSQKGGPLLQVHPTSVSACGGHSQMLNSVNKLWETVRESFVGSLGGWMTSKCEAKPDPEPVWVGLLKVLELRQRFISLPRASRIKN